MDTIDGNGGSTKEHKARFASGTETELKSGQYIYSRRFFTRLKANPAAGGAEDKDDYSLGLTTVVTFREDRSVVLDVTLHNDIYNSTQPTRGLTAFHFDLNHHPELNGTVNFLSMKILNVPTGFTIASVVDDSSMETAGATNWFVKPEVDGLSSGGPYSAFVQRLWPRQRIMRRYVLVPDSMGAAAAQHIAQFRGYGAAIGGPLANYRRDWWGGGATPPEFTDQYKIQSNGTTWEGREAVHQFATAYKQRILDALTLPQIGADFQASSANQGWWRGVADKWATNGGSPLIHFWDGFSQVDDHLCALWVRMSYQVQRHTTGLIDPAAGAIVTPEMLAESNDKESVPGVKELPFSESRQDFANYSGWFPWFIIRGVASVNNPWTFTFNSNLGLGPFLDATGNPPPGFSRVGAPVDRAWNDAATGAQFAQEDVVYQFNGVDAWGPGPGTHEPRFTSGSEALSFACDLEVAKWIVAQQSNHVQRVMAVRTSTASGFPDQRNGQSIKAGIDIYKTDTSRARQGGLKVSITPHGGGGIIDWGRGSGHQIACVGYHASLVPHADSSGSPTPEYLGLKNWAEWVARLADWIGTDWGATARRPMDILARGRGNSCDYGPKNDVQQFGARAWVSGIPGETGPGLSYQVFQAAIVQRGIFALEHALAPRVPTSDPNRPSVAPQDPPQVDTDAPHLRLIDSLTASMWEAMDEWVELRQGVYPSVEVKAFEPGLLASTPQERDTQTLFPDIPYFRPLSSVHTVSNDQYPVTDPTVSELAEADAADSQVVWALPSEPNPRRFEFQGNEIPYNFDQLPVCLDPDSGGPLEAIGYPPVANDRCLIMPWASHSVAVDLARGQVHDYLRWMRRQARTMERDSIPELIAKLLQGGGPEVNYENGHNRSELLQFLAAAGDLQRKFRSGDLFPTAQTAGLGAGLNGATLLVHPGGAIPTTDTLFEKRRFSSPITFSHAVTFRDCFFDDPASIGGTAVSQLASGGSNSEARFERCEFNGRQTQADVRFADFYLCSFLGASSEALRFSEVTEPSFIRECYIGPLGSGAVSGIEINQVASTSALRITDTTIDLGDVGASNVVGLRLDANGSVILRMLLSGCYLNGGRVCIEVPDTSGTGMVGGMGVLDSHFGRDDRDGLIDKAGLTGQFVPLNNVYRDNGESADDDL